MRRAAWVLLLGLVWAGEAQAQAQGQAVGPCARCHLGQPRIELGLALGPSLSPGQEWSLAACPALAQLRRRQAALEERLDYLAAWLPGLAEEHYPLAQPQAGLAQAQGLLRQALSNPVASLEEALVLLERVERALAEQVEAPLRAHEERLARLQGGGWLALGLLLTGLAWLGGWRRLLPGRRPAAGAAPQAEEGP